MKKNIKNIKKLNLILISSLMFLSLDNFAFAENIREKIQERKCDRRESLILKLENFESKSDNRQKQKDKIISTLSKIESVSNAVNKNKVKIKIEQINEKYLEIYELENNLKSNLDKLKNNICDSNLENKNSLEALKIINKELNQKNKDLKKFLQSDIKIFVQNL